MIYASGHLVIECHFIYKWPAENFSLLPTVFRVVFSLSLFAFSVPHFHLSRVYPGPRELIIKYHLVSMDEAPLLSTDLTFGLCLNIWCRVGEYLITCWWDRARATQSYSWVLKLGYILHEIALCVFLTCLSSDMTCRSQKWWERGRRGPANCLISFIAPRSKEQWLFFFLKGIWLIMKVGRTQNIHSLRAYTQLHIYIKLMTSDNCI